MKRFCVVLLVLLLLTGCSFANPDPTGETVQTQTEPTADVTEATEPPGLYMPQSAAEQATGGAIRAYMPEDPDTYALGIMGDNVLVFSYAHTVETNGTAITAYSGENCAETATVHLNCMVTPGTQYATANDKGFAYYDEMSNAVVVLNPDFSEKLRATMPEDMLGYPAIAPDMDSVYYFTDTELMVLDLSAGVSRLLRQQSYSWQGVTYLSFDGSILGCDIVDGEDDFYLSFISAETGAVLDNTVGIYDLTTDSDSYFLSRSEGSRDEYLFGQLDSQAYTFYPEEDGSAVYALLNMNSVATVYYDDLDQTHIGLYDLATGRKTASVSVKALGIPHSVMADAQGRFLWFLSYDEAAQRQILYRWDPQLSQVEEDTVYTSIRYTEDAPDTVGLALCQERADALSEQYGVDIDLRDIVKPSDYTLTEEFLVPAFESGLDALEAALASLPQDFLAKLSTVSESGVLHVSLVRDISDASGLQYWVDGDAYISVAIGDLTQETFYHELCHVLDTYVFSNSRAFDDWEELNPEGVSYDYNYTDYFDHFGDELIEGIDRVFIDAYCMTYPKEDRARILQYAMMPYNADYFTSETMQSKLYQLCYGIREAFGWKKKDVLFPWEQYLNVSMVGVK